jgi:hypothetical protein
MYRLRTTGQDDALGATGGEGVDGDVVADDL